MALPVQHLSYWIGPHDTYGGWVTSPFLPSEVVSAKWRNGVAIRLRSCRTFVTVFKVHRRNFSIYASSSVEKSHQSGGEEQSQSGKMDEFGNGNSILPHSDNPSGSSTSFVEDVLQEPDNSLDSIEGLADVHQEREKSLDSIMGLATEEEWRQKEDDRRTETESSITKSLDSIEGVASDLPSGRKNTSRFCGRFYFRATIQP